MTDGVRALEHLNLLLEKHLSVSVISFFSCLYNYFFPRVPIKTPPNQTVASTSIYARLFNIQGIWWLEASIEIQFKQATFCCTHRICLQYAPVFSSAIISWWCCRGSVLRPLGAKRHQRSITNEHNLGGLAASQWWVKHCSLHLIGINIFQTALAANMLNWQKTDQDLALTVVLQSLNTGVKVMHCAFCKVGKVFRSFA